MRPRTRTALLLFPVSGAAALWLAVQCEAHAWRTHAFLNRVSAANAPRDAPLQSPYYAHISSASLSDGTEVGEIRLLDGSVVQFWFRSHHLSEDMGGTVLRLPDGSTAFMAGWFCCNVDLPQLASAAELRAFIDEHDGVWP